VPERWDAVVIGGGFYGATLACHLKRRGLSHVLLIEREQALLQRASYNNQARIHAGYHYPRSLTTAARCRQSVERFLGEHPGVLRKGGLAVYAVARTHSHTSPRQFVRFCAAIGAPLTEAPSEVWSLFDRDRIDAVYLVEESVMDADVLRVSVTRTLSTAGVEVWLGQAVDRLSSGVLVHLSDTTIRARHVFNCTYSALDTLADVPALRHERAELAIVDLPELSGMSITVMDGPFFSLLPHPPTGLHTLSHVRHTPHGEGRALPVNVDSRFDRMVRAASPFLPALRDARYVRSIFETKTLLPHNEVDDGRPILLARSASVPGVWSVLGGKIDNVYDVLDRLDAEPIA
jgi:glycine/D-amino acid oxidase-like deaminating enzyme